MMENLALPVDVDWMSWLFALGWLVVAVVGGLAVHSLLFALLKRVARHTTWRMDEIVVRRMRAPARLILPLMAIQLVLPYVFGVKAGLEGFLRHAVSIGAIAAIVWLVIALAETLATVVRRDHVLEADNNLDARRIHTQIDVLKRTVEIFAVIVGIAAVLMTFPRVRELGASILASAGLAGLAVGVAARPVLENLIAGIQIALTQPIRLDDVVIIDGEWGRIEEITGTYVVLRVWDQRTLIVPFSRIIGQSFQNWTRTGSEILGTVTLHADYTVPVQAVREELERLVGQSDKWDGRVVNLQVTDAKERTIELRALVSAKDAGSAWELRVWLRERLIDFLQQRYPESLPRYRVSPGDAPAPRGARAAGDESLAAR